ncbi:hypothetical protein FRC02_003386 [Tulasnella sp. 418]|nr:hypothetical protein FRC02_003386 [Tulasnella sp. 418]
MASTEGASKNEQLLHAAKEDNEELLLSILEDPKLREGDFDINHKDGLGNTALHYAAERGSIDALEHLLGYEGCDVDLQNRLEHATPLHLAVKLKDFNVRQYVVDSLLVAGADMKIKNKDGELPIDLLAPDDTATKALFRKAQASNAVSKEAVADDSEGDPESGSEE